MRRDVATAAGLVIDQPKSISDSSLWSMALALLGMSGAIGISHGLSAGQFSSTVALAVFSVLLVSLGLGSQLCQILKIHDEQQVGSHGIDFIDALLLGLVTLSILLLAFALVSSWSISTNFLFCAGAVLIANCYTYYKSLKDITKEEDLVPRLNLSQTGLYSLMMTTIAAILWSSENLRGIKQISPDIFVSYPWQDIFSHTTNVARFMNSHGQNSLGNEQLLGLPLQIYHYASYMIPALLARLSGSSAYTLTVSSLPLLGMIWTGMAAYLIGKRCVSSKVGAFTAFAVLYVPDPSFWGLGNSLTSYFFFQQIGMGGLYGVAVMALATSHGLRAIECRSLVLLASAAILIGCAALYKVQIVLVYGVPLFVVLLSFFPFQRKRMRVVAIAITILSYIGLIQLVAHIPRAPTLAFSTQGAIANVDYIVSWFPHQFSNQLKTLVNLDSSYWKAILYGVPLILLTNYGIWLLGWAAFFRFAKPQWINRRFLVALGVSVTFTHLVVALCLAPNEKTSLFGDSFEIILKTFVWPYFIFTTICSVMLGVWLKSRLKAISPQLKTRYVAFTSVAGILLLYLFGPTVQSTSTAKAPGATKIQVPRDFYETANYLRLHTHRDAIVQYSGNDGLLSLTALSERKSFVIQCTINCGSGHASIPERINQLMSALSQSDVSKVRSQSRLLGIDWLVIRGQPWEWQNHVQAEPDARFGNHFLYATFARDLQAPNGSR